MVTDQLFEPHVRYFNQLGLDEALIYIATVELERTFVDFTISGIPNTRIELCVHNINYQIDQNEYGNYNHR